MVIPVHDENHVYDHAVRPWTMWLVFAVNVLVLAYFSLLPAAAVYALAYHFGVVPAFVTGSIAAANLDLMVPPLATLVTYTFLHSSWIHLAGNMIFLWVLGDNVEASTGHWRFLAFYVLCGIAGGLAHIAAMPDSAVPLIGASGAVAGIVVAYLMLHPWAHITVLVFGLMTVRLHAYWILGAWIAWQVASVLVFADTDVSYWSHLGGMAAGAVLIVVLRRPGVPLFQGHIPIAGER